tara:strand:+ start:834 stop:1067 length:234 start_codon:yes stop_codon:yes gene_type:complete
MQAMDGYDDCIAGVCTRYGQPPILIYDRSKVISGLESEGMTNEEAEEYFDFNQIGAWVGDDTPAFIEPYDKDRDYDE